MSIFTKIRDAANISLDSYINKAKASIVSQNNHPIIERKAYDNLTLNDNADAGYKERIRGIPFEVLRRLASQNAVVASIIQTFVLKIKNYSQPQNDKYSPGFKIVLRDKKEESNEEHDKNIKALENWILNTGSDVGRKEENRMDFTTFLSLLTRDILTYDQMAIETIPDRSGRLSYFLPVSGGSIRYAANNINKGKFDQITNGFSFHDEDQQLREEEINENDQRRSDEEHYKYLQVYGARVIRGFYEDELILKMLNPTNELDSNGYSTGPLEMAATIVSYHLFSETHNKNFFSQGVATKGVLNLKGELPSHKLEDFRKEWQERVASTNNAWRTPIIGGSDVEVQWIPLSQSNKDMEWSSWMEYLLKILTALFSIAPQEINFDITRSGSPGLSESGSKSAIQFKESKDKGLKPLLEFFEGVINESLIKRFDENLYKKYKFQFCGIDSESREDELKRQKDEVQNYKTINEIRAEHDLKPLEEGGDIILSPTYMQWFVNFSNQAQKQLTQQNQNADLNQDSFENGSENNEDDLPLEDLDNIDSEDIEQSIEKLTAKSLTAKPRKNKSPKLLKIEYYKK